MYYLSKNLQSEAHHYSTTLTRPGTEYYVHSISVFQFFVSYFSNISIFSVPDPSTVALVLLYCLRAQGKRRVHTQYRVGPFRIKNPPKIDVQ
jgi:hypothetical protein